MSDQERQANLDAMRFYKALLPLLVSYECDRPHWDEKVEGYYPTIDFDEFVSRLSQPHHGDCTNEPQPCIRCHAEDATHKALWLAERLAVSMNKSM